MLLGLRRVWKQLIGVRLAGAVSTGRPETTIGWQWLSELPDWLAPVRLGHLIHHTCAADVTDPAVGVAGNVEVIERAAGHRAPGPGSTYA